MSEEDDDWMTRPDHPLLNNLVLKKVFQHLGKKELKECRLVCKTWNVSTIPFTRKEFNVNIFQDNFQMPDFVKDFGSNELGIPVTINFKLFSSCTREGLGHKFLQLCGNTIRSLEFLGDNFIVEDFSEILKLNSNFETLEIPKRLCSSSGSIVKLFPEDSKPRLTSLKNFTIVHDNPNERDKFCPTFLEELITAAPNISCINIRDGYPDGVDDEDYNFSSIEVLRLIEKLGREPTVQELNISLTKSDHSECVELLRKMAGKRNGLKLKKLQYGSYCFDQDSQAIVQIIPLFKDTLEFIKLVDGKYFTSFIEFPVMPCLTHLFLYIYRTFNLKFVNLRQIFPRLEKLELYFMGYLRAYDEFFPESEPCPAIKCLQLHSISLNIIGFHQMRTLFPNLIDLQVNIKKDGEEILRQIWTQMTQLESLSISGAIQVEDSLDCVFTGISSHVLTGIMEFVINLEEVTEDERRQGIMRLMSQHSHSPSIANLTKLRSLALSLTGNGADGCEYLTNLTGYLGFYSIQSLKELIVGFCSLTEFCCGMLTKDMGLEFGFFTSECDEVFFDSTWDQ